ncbi:MAG: CoA transferase [Chloroflexi bacterium]|nr:CoA transferase [Chloroflexota bacterium]
MTVCLEGIRVLEFARYQAGPRCGLLLRDLGAEVIKIESVGGEDLRTRGPFVEGISIGFAMYNRGKKSITLNTRDERAKDILRQLVKRSDLVLENFRPGVMDKMGFGYEDLRKINPGIIMVSASGFGQYGPYRDRPAFDPVGQAMSGIAHLTGGDVGMDPILTAAPIVDRSTALHACIGALGALYHRKVTGEGQWVETSLLDSALTLVDVEICDCYNSGQVSGRTATTIACKDGSVVISPSRAHQWVKVYQAMGRDDLANNPSFATRSVSKEQVKVRQQLLRDWTKTQTVADVLKIMEDADVPCGPAYSIEQVVKDKHLWERKMMVPVEAAPGIKKKMLVPGETIKMSKVPWKEGRAPTPGEHNEEILGGLLGMSADELAKLKQDGVI